MKRDWDGVIQRIVHNGVWRKYGTDTELETVGYMLYVVRAVAECFGESLQDVREAYTGLYSTSSGDGRNGHVSDSVLCKTSRLHGGRRGLREKCGDSGYDSFERSTRRLDTEVSHSIWCAVCEGWRSV